MGWYQLEMFKSGSSADEIVKLFDQLESIRKYFYKELIAFADQRKMT